MEFTGMQKEAPTEKVTIESEISIAGPVGTWIAILVIGLLIEFVVIPLLHPATSSLKTIANLILFQPGAIILPLIMAAWTAAKVGHAYREKEMPVAKVGVVNGVYLAVIYSIAIFVIYLLLQYIYPAGLPTSFTLMGFGLNLIIIPDAIVLAVVPVLSLVSAARHPKQKVTSA